ncbi:MAG: hypothetical protein IT318_23990 [Anaerolineales bacterium]|nr:hypothetical protein [Anaerolineales bacterium]
MNAERNLMGDTYTPRDALDESSRMTANAQALAAAQSAVGHLAARVADLEDDLRRTRAALGCANLEVAVLRQIIRRRGAGSRTGVAHKGTVRHEIRTGALSHRSLRNDPRSS